MLRFVIAGVTVASAMFLVGASSAQAQFVYVGGPVPVSVSWGQPAPVIWSQPAPVVWAQPAPVVVRTPSVVVSTAPVTRVYRAPIVTYPSRPVVIRNRPFLGGTVIRRW